MDAETIMCVQILCFVQNEAFALFAILGEAKGSAR